MPRSRMNIILVCLMVVGVCILAYPTFSDWWNSFHQSRAIAQYSETVANMDRDSYQGLIDAARDYNTRLAETGPQWFMDEDQKKEYESLLNYDGSGIMGFISIPKINVQLPLFHGTDDAVLQTSIGHIEGTSLPVGGESSHCVLSGHRGLPSARLFSDLDKLVEGDTFTLTVLDETLTYQVDQIRIVEPDDLSNLGIVDGQDLCTLVTCTPYGVNTHRLLVRGHRIPNADGDANLVADALQVRPIYIAAVIALATLVVLAVYVLVHTRRSRRTNEDIERDYLNERGL